MKIPITLGMVVNDEAPRLKEKLPIWRDLFEEIVMVVQESADDSLAIAKSYADKVYEDKQYGFSEISRPTVLENASFPWMIYLDPDESPTPKFLEDIPNLIKSTELDGYVTPFLHYPVYNPKGDIMFHAMCDDRQERLRLFKPTEITTKPQLHTAFYPKNWSRIGRLNYITIEHRKTFEEWSFDHKLYQKVLGHY